jgi:hypothetical protein
VDVVQCIESAEGMIDLEEALLLYRLASEVAEGCIVEVGAYRGRSAVALGLGSLDGHGAPVYSFDPHETFTGILGRSFGADDRAAYYRTMLQTSCYRIVRLVNLSSEIVAPQWMLPVGLLWIDGDHRYEAVARDFRCWEPHLTAAARIAFDDSLDPSIGPKPWIDELVEQGTYEIVDQVGKVTVISRRAGAGGSASAERALP